MIINVKKNINDKGNDGDKVNLVSSKFKIFLLIIYKTNAF